MLKRAWKRIRFNFCWYILGRSPKGMGRSETCAMLTGLPLYEIKLATVEPTDLRGIPFPADHLVIIDDHDPAFSVDS